MIGGGRGGGLRSDDARRSQHNAATESLRCYLSLGKHTWKGGFGEGWWVWIRCKWKKKAKKKKKIPSANKFRKL